MPQTQDDLHLMEEDSDDDIEYSDDDEEDSDAGELAGSGASVDVADNGNATGARIRFVWSDNLADTDLRYSRF